jgi:broad specificity phosphatase PhoE
MIVALIPCGSTEWQEEGRLLGRVELPLTEAGQEKCATWVQGLSTIGLECILHGPDELATRTAQVLARQLSIPTKALDDLVELDVGLGAGLTEAQLKTRFASAHRELRESPLNVNPPGGESLSAAADRLCACIRKQMKKNGRKAIGVVVRPFGFALARCVLEGVEFSDVWRMAQHADEPTIIECRVPTGRKVAP